VIVLRRPCRFIYSCSPDIGSRVSLIRKVDPCREDRKKWKTDCLNFLKSGLVSSLVPRRTRADLGIIAAQKKIPIGTSEHSISRVSGSTEVVSVPCFLCSCFDLASIGF